MRMGHLASDLLRVATFLKDRADINTVGDILEESKFFIEWTMADAPSEVQVLFADIQPRLALWQYRLSQRKKDIVEIEELQKSAKDWSAQLIDMSGLAV